MLYWTFNSGLTNLLLISKTDGCFSLLSPYFWSSFILYKLSVFMPDKLKNKYSTKEAMTEVLLKITI